MHIGIFVHYFPKTSETFVLNQITGLIDRGHDVSIVAYRDPCENQLQEEVTKYGLLEKTHYCGIPKTRGAKAKGIVRLTLKHIWREPSVFAQIIRNFPSNPKGTAKEIFECDPFLYRDFDVVLNHFGPPSIRAAHLKSHGAIKAPIVAMFHGIGIRMGKDEGSEMYTPLFESADRILATSENMKRDLVKLGADPEIISIHHVGIDLDRFQFQIPSPQPPVTNLKILSVGRFVREKGHEMGIRSIKMMKNMNPDIDVEYHLIGGGRLQNKLQSLTRELGLTDEITISGAKSREQINKEMQIADVYLQPSISESTGMVLLEAQAVGTPVITTNVGGIPNSVYRTKPFQFVSPREEGSFANSLNKFIQCPEIWEEIAINGRKYVEKNFDINKLNSELSRKLMETRNKSECVNL